MKVNEEFKRLIPALTVEEYKQLEANILSEGIRDPLVVWNGYLVDGHNRYTIASQHGLEYKTVNKEFKDGNAVKIWMIDNQNGRRNLTDGWKYKLQQIRKEILLEKGKEEQAKAGGDKKTLLSIVDKSDVKIKEHRHNTQQEVAKGNGHKECERARPTTLSKRVAKYPSPSMPSGASTIFMSLIVLIYESKKRTSCLMQDARQIYNK